MDKRELDKVVPCIVQERRARPVHFIHARPLMDAVVDFLWEMDGKDYPGEASKEHAVVHRLGEPKRKLSI